MVPRAAVVVLVCALLLPLPVDGGEVARPVRVVTFNLLHGGPESGLIGDGEALETRLALTTTELRQLAADVIGLQEASVGRGRGNVAERLAAALGMHYVHASATLRVFPIAIVNKIIVTLMNFAEGPALLSRFPITASEVYDLPRCTQRLSPRVLLRAEVDTPWGPLAAFSTHVSRDDCQIARVAEIVRARAAKGPTVLMGDFNTSETAPSIVALNGDVGFVDAFRASNATASGLTVGNARARPRRPCAGVSTTSSWPVHRRRRASRARVASCSTSLTAPRTAARCGRPITMASWPI